MKIAFCSYTYAPTIGGTETAGRLLAGELRRRGHEVLIFTETPGERRSGILRNPSLRQIVQACRNSDLVFLNNISLRYAWAAFLMGRPLVITTHSYIEGKAWKQALKKAVLNRARANISASPDFMDFLPARATYIPPPFDSTIFRDSPNTHRPKSLVFVGRLVSRKGVDLLLESLVLLRQKDSMTPDLTIVGDGEDRNKLEARALSLNLKEQVKFTGPLEPPALAQILRESKVMVVPSRTSEPFGIVALEGIASGAYVIGSDKGGLPDAIGPCGATFPIGNTESLAELLSTTLKKSAWQTINAEARHNHLARFTPMATADRYLKIFEDVLAK